MTKNIFKFLETADLKDEEVLKEAIRKSVELKAWVVNQDEKEAGIRAVLNYGHTFGHVVENETKYTTYLHGEAVAIGMVMANALAVELGLFTQAEADEVKFLLQKSCLPTEYVIKDVDAFYEHFFLDKKSANNSIKFILPDGMGGHKMVSDIDAMLVKNVLIKVWSSTMLKTLLLLSFLSCKFTTCKNKMRTIVVMRLENSPAYGEKTSKSCHTKRCFGSQNKTNDIWTKDLQ